MWVLNKLWPIFIVVSVAFSLFVGRIDDVSGAVFVSLEDTVGFVFKFLGIMCFWSGIIAVLRETSVIDKLGRVIGPVVNFFFKSVSDEVKELITINMISNLIGIGNAATPMRYCCYEEDEWGEWFGWDVWGDEFVCFA